MTVVGCQLLVVGDNARAKLMSGKTFLWLLTIVLLGTVSAEAQQPVKIPRIGYLSATRPQPRDEAFRQGLRELGYVEGQNIAIEWRFAEGKLDQVPRNARELVRLKVDIIVTTGPADTRAAKEATSEIPIVMAQDSDPVGSGFVASLARPGGNITGLSNLASEISGKRLELLKETVPKLSHVAVLQNLNEPGNAQALTETQLAAQSFGIILQYFDVKNLKDAENAFREARKGRNQAVLMLANAVVSNYPAQIAKLAVKNRLPAIHIRRDFVESGGLMSYGPSLLDLWHRAATYVDKILKGAKPADIPVEQPTKFEFVINLKAAKQIGLTIPPNVLARANKVIR
jgi:putative tryptophan/tyrosine transport system substrate-binding protein